MPFPLPFIPKLSYKTGGRKFGAPRDGGLRKHAGCDLIVPQWTEIFAIDDGYVVETPRQFYRGTWQLAIRHPVGLVRYCEVQGEALIKSYHKGKKVKAGEVIAHVGKMYRDSMLHFELYKCSATGPLTVRSNAGFQRRTDLTDPAPLLDRLASDVRAANGREAASAEAMALMTGTAPV
jgi:murein DD-endopeptidase MepM/ murein hydrolase activator NlpD